MLGRNSLCRKEYHDNKNKIRPSIVNSIDVFVPITDEMVAKHDPDEACTTEEKQFTDDDDVHTLVLQTLGPPIATVGVELVIKKFRPDNVTLPWPLYPRLYTMAYDITGATHNQKPL